MYYVVNNFYLICQIALLSVNEFKIIAATVGYSIEFKKEK